MTKITQNLQKGMVFKMNIGEYSYGAVTFTVENGVVKYLVVTEKAGHTGIPKGRAEQGETPFETAVREITEETGITATLIGDFSESIIYPKGDMLKQTTYFLARFDKQVPRQNSEVSTVHLVEFDEALEMITHDNAKGVLKSANAYLKEHLT